MDESGVAGNMAKECDSDVCPLKLEHYYGSLIFLAIFCVIGIISVLLENSHALGLVTWNHVC